MAVRVSTVVPLAIAGSGATVGSDCPRMIDGAVLTPSGCNESASMLPTMAPGGIPVPEIKSPGRNLSISSLLVSLTVSDPRVVTAPADVADVVEITRLPMTRVPEMSSQVEDAERRGAERDGREIARARDAALGERVITDRVVRAGAPGFVVDPHAARAGYSMMLFSMTLSLRVPLMAPSGSGKPVGLALDALFA